ncbi:MAG: hypothetical protein IT585_05165 [candidate division Zixibacteria bacterium]|nr:hypothetical protein [candidate division Zixibacteria bacterium]
MKILVVLFIVHAIQIAYGAADTVRTILRQPNSLKAAVVGFPHVRLAPVTYTDSIKSVNSRVPWFTGFSFDLSDSGLVRITVCDTLGTPLDTLVDRDLSMGSYYLDLGENVYPGLPSGIYIFSLTLSGNEVWRKKVVWMK